MFLFIITTCDGNLTEFERVQCQTNPGISLACRRFFDKQFLFDRNSFLPHLSRLSRTLAMRNKVRDDVHVIRGMITFSWSAPLETTPEASICQGIRVFQANR